MSQLGWTAFCIGNFLYWSQHWIFAVSYLRIAVIFKLAFSYESAEVQLKCKRRIILINVVLYLGLLVFAFP